MATPALFFSYKEQRYREERSQKTYNDGVKAAAKLYGFPFKSLKGVPFTAQTDDTRILAYVKGTIVELELDSSEVGPPRIEHMRQFLLRVAARLTPDAA